MQPAAQGASQHPVMHVCTAVATALHLTLSARSQLIYDRTASDHKKSSVKGVEHSTTDLKLRDWVRWISDACLQEVMQQRSLHGPCVAVPAKALLQHALPGALEAARDARPRQQQIWLQHQNACTASSISIFLARLDLEFCDNLPASHVP